MPLRDRLSGRACACGLRLHHARALEGGRLRRSRYGRAAMVLCLPKSRILPRDLHVLLLHNGGLHVLLTPNRDLLRSRPRLQPAPAAVETYPVLGPVHRHLLVVYVGDVGHVRDVGDRAIVEEAAVAPLAAVVAATGVAEAIVDAAVEADAVAPVAGVEAVDAVGISPIARRPQQADARRPNSDARHPIVAEVVIVVPIARRPKVAGFRDRRLHVDR